MKTARESATWSYWKAAQLAQTTTSRVMRFDALGRLELIAELPDGGKLAERAKSILEKLGRA